MIKKCSILCLFLLNFVVYWNETGWVLETGFKVHASFGAEMEGGPGNNDWGCEGSVSGGMECDEIVITPTNPCNLPGADLCECFGIGCNPCLEPDADPCECYGTGCDEDRSEPDPCEDPDVDRCYCLSDCGEEETTREKDPCEEKEALKDFFTSHFSDMISALIEKAIQSSYEWGTTLRVDFEGNPFVSAPVFYADTINTDESANSYTGEFSWNAAQGELTIGFLHTHPAARGNIPCLSVNDVWTLEAYVDFYFAGEYETRRNFLNEYVCVVAIHESGIYAMTVKDWEGLRDFFDTHTLENVRDGILADMLTPLSYTYEAAFLKVLGNYLNLYKSSTTRDVDFQVIKQKEDDTTKDEIVSCD